MQFPSNSTNTSKQFNTTYTTLLTKTKKFNSHQISPSQKFHIFMTNHLPTNFYYNLTIPVDDSLICIHHLLYFIYQTHRLYNQSIQTKSDSYITFEFLNLILFYTYFFKSKTSKCNIHNRIYLHNSNSYQFQFIMNWVTKKFILSQVKKYFHIEKEEQIQIEILGDHQLTFKDLKLRTNVVNQNTSNLHVQQLTLQTISISYDKSRDQPIQVILDGAKLVVAFNPKPCSTSQPSARDHLKPFFDAIASKQLIKQRGFIAQQIFQLKNLLTEFFIGKISLLIRNVDVSIQYQSQKQIRYFGLQLGEVNIKQRMVINHQDSEVEQIREQQILCSLQAVSMYLGVTSEQDRIQQLAQNRQILRKTKTIKKIYILEKERINLYYSLNQNSISVNIKQLNLKCNKLIAVQLMKVSNYLQYYLGSKPKLRPGQGEKKTYIYDASEIQFRESTVQWWQYTITSILQKVQEKIQSEILTNIKYRLYLFLLFYKYTFGSNGAIDRHIEEYQKRKLIGHIMASYSLVLNRIQMMREEIEDNEQLQNLIKFLQFTNLVKIKTKQIGLKYLTYKKIKESKIFFNLRNCTEYIQKLSNKSSMAVIIQVENKIKITVYESKYDSNLIKDGLNLNPSDFYDLKSKYINKFYKKMTEEGLKDQKQFMMIQISKLDLNKSKDQLKINIPSILMENEQKQIILKINNIALYKQSKVLYTQTNHIILSQKNQYIRISSFFFNLQKQLVSHLLTLKVLLSDNPTKPLTDQQQFQNFLYQNIYNRLPNHPYLQNHNDQSSNIEIQKLILVTSVFTDNLYATIEINGLIYSCPLGSKNSITIDKLSVSRNKIVSFQKLKSKKIQKMLMEQESLILENNKPLRLFFQNIRKRTKQDVNVSKKKTKYVPEKDPTSINTNKIPEEKSRLDILSFKNPQSKTFQSINNNPQKPQKQKKCYRFFQSITDIAIPFLLIQISFTDIYYLMLLLNSWKQIFSNPFYFPQRRDKTYIEKKIIQLSEDKIQYLNNLHLFVTCSKTSVKLEGIQLIIYGQHRESSNEVMSMLIENIQYKNTVKILSTDTQISIKNIFIENCLGKKTFNFQKLKQIIQKTPQTQEQLIYTKKQDQSQNSLIFYGINSQSGSFSKIPNLINIKIQNKFDLSKLKKQQTIDIIIQPLFIYHSPDFYQIMTKSLSIIGSIADKNKNTKQIKFKIESKISDHQILQAKDIAEILTINIIIDKVNLIVLHQLSPIFTISLLNVAVKHHTEPYVTKYQIDIQQFYIVDISPNCGLHPKVMKSFPMKCYYISYNSQLLRRKQKKSALLKIKFQDCQIFYLNRKIKQLVNFIMDNFSSADPQQPKKQSANSQINDTPQPQQIKTYPFCYRIQFIKPKLVLLRSSFSQQKMIGQIDLILIANYLDQIKPNHNQTTNFFLDNQSQFQQPAYQDCQEIGEEEIHFQSFCQDKEEQQQREEISAIYIQIKQMFIYRVDKQQPIINSEFVDVKLIGKVLQANIPQLNLDLSEDDYRLLIRFTQQNFGEAPVSYPKQSVLASQKNVLGFKSIYNIQTIKMAIFPNNSNQKIGQLILKNLNGQNIMYTNGQKDDNIDIDDLTYVSCLEYDLEIVIQKKNIMDQFNDNNYDKYQDQRLKKQNYFRMYEGEFKQQTEDQEKADKFFKEDQLPFQNIVDGGDPDIQRGIDSTARRKKEDTNLQKIGKWIGGMCKKCMCCFKKQQPTNDSPSPLIKQPIQDDTQKISLRLQQLHQNQQESNLNEEIKMNQQQAGQYCFCEDSFIEDEQQIIRLEGKIESGDAYLNIQKDKKDKKSNRSKCIIMRIHALVNKQKIIQMLVRHLDIFYQKNKHIMAMINFFNKPYQEAQKLPYVKEAVFNNYRPFQMLTELYNSSIYIKQTNTIDQKYIEIGVRMVYNMERQGDTKNGPGRGLAEADVSLEMSFYDQKIKKKVPFSGQIRMIYEKETIVSYHHRQQIKNNQKMLVFGVPNQKQKIITNSRLFKQDHLRRENEQMITFKIPVFIIKPMMELFKDLGSKNQQPKLKEQPIKQINKKYQEKADKILIKISKEIKKSALVKQKVARSKMTRQNHSKAYETSNQISKAERIDQIIVKQNKKLSENQQKNRTIRIIYVPNIQINIETKSDNSFIQTFINQINMKTIQLAKKQFSTSYQIIELQMKINYWNLSLGKFEPFLEKSHFKVFMHAFKKNNTQSNRIKLLCASQQNSNHSFDYRSGLSINLSTAFFHTYKQLQLKYMLGNEQTDLNGQKCLDLTKKVIKSEKVSSSLVQKIHEKPFPEQLKNFFGRQFKIQDLNQLVKRKTKRSQIYKNKFHIQGLRVFLYHSFLEAKTKLKSIHYRTPFRIYNMSQHRMILKFDPIKQPKWEYELQYRQYYSLPQDIYEYDFLVNFASLKKHGLQQQLSNLSKMPSLNKHPNSTISKQQQQQYMSVKYLIQMHANKSQYHQMQKHKLYDYLFNLSNIQTRLIDRRDITIKTNKYTFTIINIKSQCDHIKNKYIDGSKIVLYDSLTIIISPIIIYNYTTLNFNIINCRGKKYQIATGKSIELCEFPKNIEMKDIVIDFSEDVAHTQYRFLGYDIGTTMLKMEIDRKQSINLKIIKETYSTCTVELYPDWLIVNETELEFQLEYEKERFAVDPASMGLLAINQWNNKGNQTMKIKLYDRLNPDQKQHKFITETDLIDIFTLVQMMDRKHKETIILSEAKRSINQLSCWQCSKTPSNPSFPSKFKQDEVFKCIQLVITISQNPIYKLTKNLIINYKYLILNDMDAEMHIYQYSNDIKLPNLDADNVNASKHKDHSNSGNSNKEEDGQQKQEEEEEEGILLMKIPSKSKKYLFTYDFLPKQYFIKYAERGKTQMSSNYFTIDDTIGRSLSLKLKKTEHDLQTSTVPQHEKYSYVRIDTYQQKYTTNLHFSFINEQQVKHPYYINNVTNYFVKITQNGVSFKIKPRTKTPFVWSNLINNSHQIQVQIQGNSKIYSLKQKSQFEPIIIYGDPYMKRKIHQSQDSSMLFKKQKCMMTYQNIEGKYMIILDIFTKKLHISSKQSITLALSEAERIVENYNKIRVYFKNKDVLEFQPSLQTCKEWFQLLQKDIEDNINDKIFFTIESLQNSILFFIHNVDITSNNDIKHDYKQFIVQNLYISIINSNPADPEQILLINMEDIQIIVDERLCKIMQQSQNQNYSIKKIQQCLKIKKLKINNQLNHALNPVILSQIKKSNYPFLEVKRERQNIIRNNKQILENQQEQIQHYKSGIYFLDEAELMVEAALIPQILNIKKSIDLINNQYSYQTFQEKQHAQKNKQKIIKIKNPLQYYDYMQIKPIKMTVSVSFDANIDSQFQPKLMSFLTLIPAGVQNAIITIDSYIFHHLFLEQSRLKSTLKQYYMYQMKKQILYNAGSIQMLAPIQLVQGLGIGVKNIFYNPFYEVYHTKEIQHFTTTLIQGLITFLVFIVSLCFQFMNGLFKFIAFFTFDRNYQSKRQMFRRQIFKSPIDGFNLGSRYLFKIIKQFFTNFLTWPCQYNKSFFCLGLFFGLLLAILNVIPWIIKIIVALYDFVYVIGLGIISWGYYQQNSMKYRSRPIRTFPHKQLYDYDFLTAKGNQIVRRNQIEQNQDQQIEYISHIQSGDQSKYLVLSNYRILYCSHQMLSVKQIKLYNITTITVGPIKTGKNSIVQDLYATVAMQIPNQTKILCFNINVNSYDIYFKDILNLKNFIATLRRRLQKSQIQRQGVQQSHLNYKIQDDNLLAYEQQLIEHQ